MVAYAHEPCRRAAHTAAPISSHLEKQRVAYGIITLVHKLCADNAYIIRLAVDYTVSGGGKLPRLENNFLERIGKAAAVNAADYSAHFNIFF